MKIIVNEPEVTRHRVFRISYRGEQGPRIPHGAMDRLALFSEWTGTTPPEFILADQGDGWTFSDELLGYAVETGLSLDWFWLGNEKELVMTAHNAAKETRT
ncbi:hypothetical protein [Paracoccus alkanivorans]|uniref:Uncharacterized protein n=1 Tax=Paracoccus alkanivorans TaxID=2116655 RepID=A0A3M0MCP3_9RHOB|nr:hypothetical protein [Paracoccus alkanivorans]RMC35349.1 hypothetical protein C9E81_08895 [Paracoccus alkanivorans]